MKLSPLNTLTTLNQINLNNQLTNQKNTSFDAMLKNAVEEVNQKQIDGYHAMKGLATGEVKSIQEAVQRIEEAELSLKLALEVKNKALKAYKDIMAMPV